jgi:hypothetical protein
MGNGRRNKNESEKQMTKANPEYERFNTAMDKILRADPKIVKAAMDEEKRERMANPKLKRAFAPRVRRASSGKD